MLSMRKENAYNSVVASIGVRCGAMNHQEGKIDRCDRENVNRVQDMSKAWVIDRTMRMREE